MTHFWVDDIPAFQKVGFGSCHDLGHLETQPDP